MDADLLQHHAAPQGQSADRATDDIGTRPCRRPAALHERAQEDEHEQKDSRQKIAEERECERTNMVHAELLGNKRAAPDQRGGKKQE